MGERIDIYFKKVPQLVEVEVGRHYGRLFFKKLDQLFPSYYLAKLEVLKLDPYTLNVSLINLYSFSVAYCCSFLFILVKNYR